MATYLYKRALLNEPQVRKELTGGRELPSSITLEFDNADGYYSDLFRAGTEFRGESVKIEHYEPSHHPRYQTYLYAIIDTVELDTVARFSCTVQDHEPLQTTLPRTALDEDSPDNWNSYPAVNGVTIRIPPYDQGKPIALIFGNAAKVPCRYALYDADNNQWEYLIGPVDLVDSVVTVYRDKVVVPSGNYSVHTDSRYVDEDGIVYAYLRFDKEQLDFNGNPYEIEADVNSSSDYRNFIYVIQKILSETWGCEATVNATTFNSVKGNWTDCKCDGAVYNEVKAQDLIDRLLECCPRTYIYHDENGWNIAGDSSYNGTAEAHFGSGDDYYENIVDYSYTAGPSKQDVIKELKVKYQYNPWETEYPVKIERTCNSFGEDHTLELSYVRDGETADRIASRLQNLEQYANEQLQLTVGHEGRLLERYDPIDVTINWKHGQNTVNLLDGLWQVINVRHGLTDHELECRSYSSDIYTYNAGTIPSSPEDDGRTDWSNTRPNSPTNFTLDSSGTYQGSDGGTRAYVNLSADAPDFNFTKMAFGYRKSTEAIYSWVTGDEPSSGNTWSGRIEGLTPGMEYEFVALSENSFNLASTSNPTITSTAPGDTTAPATPTGLSATGQIGQIKLTWNANSEADLKEYVVQKYISWSWNVIARVGGTTYVDPNETYSSSTYYRVAAVDYSGNTSSYSSSASATPKKSDLDNDVSDGSTYARVRGTYLTNGQHKASMLLDDGGTLTLSSTRVKINQTDGFIIGGSGNIKVEDGGDIEFYGTTNNYIGKISTYTSPESAGIGIVTNDHPIFLGSGTADIHILSTSLLYNNMRLMTGNSISIGEYNYGLKDIWVQKVLSPITTNLQLAERGGTVGLEINNSNAYVLIPTRLGIGTDSPSTKLDVDGEITTDRLNVNTNTITTTADIALSANAGIYGPTSLRLFSDNSVRISIGGEGTNNSTDIVTVTDGVGIGTTSPKQEKGIHLDNNKLGNIIAEEYLGILANAYTDGTTSKRISSGQASGVGVYDNGTIMFINTGSGNADTAISWKIRMEIKSGGEMQIREADSTPGNPASGTAFLWVDNDGHLYCKARDGSAKQLT